MHAHVHGCALPVCVHANERARDDGVRVCVRVYGHVYVRGHAHDDGDHVHDRVNAYAFGEADRYCDRVF